MTTTSSSLRTATRFAIAFALVAVPACGHSRATTTRTPAASPTAVGMVQPYSPQPTSLPVMPTASNRSPGERAPMPPPLTDAAIDTRIAELRTRLALDPQQEAAVRQILTESRGRYDELRQQAGEAGGARDPALRAEFVQLHFDTEDRIYGVLRCDQKDALRVVEREERDARIAEYRAMRRRRATREGVESATTNTQEIPTP